MFGLIQMFQPLFQLGFRNIFISARFIFIRVSERVKESVRRKIDKRKIHSRWKIIIKWQFCCWTWTNLINNCVKLFKKCQWKVEKCVKSRFWEFLRKKSEKGKFLLIWCREGNFLSEKREEKNKSWKIYQNR